MLTVFPMARYIRCHGIVAIVLYLLIHLMVIRLFY